MGLGPFAMNAIKIRAWGYLRDTIPPPTVIPTVLTYSDDTQGGSFAWGGVTFTRNVSYPDYAYTAITTYIPGSQVPGSTKLTSVTIGESVTTLGAGAFQQCGALTSVTIGNSVTTLGNGAFASCGNLKSVTIPNSVTTLGDYAFFYCSVLTSVTIGNSVTTIGDYAFDSCDSLTSVTIGNSVTTIGAGAFSRCSNLTTVTIGNSVTSISAGAFSIPYGGPQIPTVYISLDTAIAVGLGITSLPQNNIYFFGRTVTNLIAL